MRSFRTMTHGEYHDACEGICNRFAALYRAHGVAPRAEDVTPEALAELGAISQAIYDLADGQMLAAMRIATVAMDEAKHRVNGGEPRFSRPDADEAHEPVAPTLAPRYAPPVWPSTGRLDV